MDTNCPAASEPVALIPATVTTGCPALEFSRRLTIPNAGTTPNERYRPDYFFKPRPTISNSPAAIAYGAGFAVQTPLPDSISELVLLRPGAVTHAFNQNQRCNRLRHNRANRD
ncbi:MAG: hypothetical protein DMG96_25170 [Acidobacteria bacterium]|nr:MAG: hypothetical protein DMG96_25170 [Acidobacteriota bacterium]